jgi:hypothetical protein
MTQPTTGHVTPSYYNPFDGYVPNGSNERQLRKAAAMAAKIAANRRRHPDLPQTYTVRLPLRQRSVFEVPRIVDIVCPVIAMRKDRTRLLVIAPDGLDQWVDWK